MISRIIIILSLFFIYTSHLYAYYEVYDLKNNIIASCNNMSNHESYEHTFSDCEGGSTLIMNSNVENFKYIDKRGSLSVRMN